MELRHNVKVKKDWFESMTRDEQLEWLESQTIPVKEKEECKKEILKSKSRKDGKRETVEGEVTKAERIKDKADRRRDRRAKSGNKGSKD